MPTVNKERVQLLVDALRSDRWVQATGTLCARNADGTVKGYCCLGVATKVAQLYGLEMLEIPNGSITTYHTIRKCGDKDCPTGGHFTQDNAVLPTAVQEWYGFDSPNPIVHRGERVTRPYDPDVDCDCEGCRSQKEVTEYWKGPLTATTANDGDSETAPWSFAEIADGFEKTYLTPESENGTQEKDQG